MEINQDRLYPEENSLLHQGQVDKKTMDTSPAESVAILKIVAVVDGMVLVQKYRISPQSAQLMILANTISH